MKFMLTQRGAGRLFWFKEAILAASEQKQLQNELIRDHSDLMPKLLRPLFPRRRRRQKEKPLPCSGVYIFCKINIKYWISERIESKFLIPSLRRLLVAHKQKWIAATQVYCVSQGLSALVEAADHTGKQSVAL